MKNPHICIGASNSNQKQVLFDLSMANRHGIIAGATGTGKTVTLQVLAEEFSRQGIPVFTADAKGDLSGISMPGKPHEKIDERLKFINLENNYTQRGTPSVFWDVYGEKGHPIRTTISEMGPMLLSRLLDLSDTQDAVLHMAFSIADDEGLLLVDLKDLKSLLQFLGENRKELSKEYGNMSTQSLNSIVRQMMVLEENGGDMFFGEKAFEFEHLLAKDYSGNGVVNILDAQKLMQNNRIYSAFLLWLLSELFEHLPEVGDTEKPKLVFFFDEAHLIFDGAPKVLLEKIEQVTRLIRSKGVGVYFVTQNPMDIPENVRGQLGNRFQHALRAFTPKEQKAAKVASETFRENPEFETKELIGQLKVGHALVSTLDEDGAPTVVEHTMVRPPEGRMGPITDAERAEKISSSPLFGIYETPVETESAYEVLKKRAEEKEKLLTENGENEEKKESGGILDSIMGTGKRQGYAETFAKQMMRSVGSRLATKIIRGLLGGLK